MPATSVSTVQKNSTLTEMANEKSTDQKILTQFLKDTKMLGGKYKPEKITKYINTTSVDPTSGKMNFKIKVRFTD